jgi:DNA-binding transcriptional MerR regulator
MFTVKRLANLAGVTTRTLHHYDQIGLLKPTSIGRNGYRYYADEALYRLQQILFYRELGMPLKEIRLIVGRGDFDVLAALETHRSALQAEASRLRRLIRTIDRTTRHLKGHRPMQPKKLFEGFSEEVQDELASEAAQRWDPETVRRSNKRWKGYSPEEKRRVLDEGNALYAEIAAVMPKGAASPEAQRLVARWHQHMKYFWSPTDQQLAGLADLYNEDPRFRRNYEAFAPGLAGFMREAVKVYVESRRR